MDFSAIGALAPGHVKQYLLHRDYPLPSSTIADLKNAMKESTAEETLLIIEVGSACKEERTKVMNDNEHRGAAEELQVPVFVVTSTRKTMFVANVEMHVEITITVRRDR